MRFSMPLFILLPLFAIGMNYHFEKTDETLYCLLGIFPPAKIGVRSKYASNRSSLLDF